MAIVKRSFGAHVSTAGGLANAALSAKRLGVNTIQLHPCAPQRWNSAAYPTGAEEAFCKLKAECGVEKVFFHGIYLINLAAPSVEHQRMGRASLSFYLDLASRICGEGVIFHVGSSRDEEAEGAGLRRAADNINRILEDVPNGARLILEVSAGGGSIIGDKMEELRWIYERIDDKRRVGYALDTQHLWASGYDIAGDTEGVIANISRILGFPKIWACHVNDSKTALGSRRDRHANLGEGLIGLEALRGFVAHTSLRDVPLILETPGLGKPETALKEIQSLRSLLGEMP